VEAPPRHRRDSICITRRYFRNKLQDVYGDIGVGGWRNTFDGSFELPEECWRELCKLCERGSREQKSAGRKLLHALDGRSAETDDEGDTPSGFAAWRSFSFSSFSPRARKDTSTSIETTTTASEDDDKPRVEVDEALRRKREQAVLDALWKKKDQKEGTMWRKSSAVRKTSIALQFGVSRGLCDVLLALRGRGYPSEVVSEFGPKPGPRCRDSETRPLSLGEKRGTRRVDGVEGLMMLPDAVFMKIS
jgi:hypothetical protein